MAVHMSDSEVTEGSRSEELRSLLRWLTDADGCRGRVAPIERPPRPGTLGPLLESITVALGSGGAATAVTTTVIAWVRSRRSDVTVKLTRPDGLTFELSGSRVKLLTDLELRALADSAAKMLEDRREETSPDAGAPE